MALVRTMKHNERLTIRGRNGKAIAKIRCRRKRDKNRTRWQLVIKTIDEPQ